MLSEETVGERMEQAHRQRGCQHVMLSEETVGEPIDRAGRERKCDHVMLSAPPTEGVHRGAARSA